MMRLLCFLLFTVSAAACFLAVQEDRIYTGDLAQALPVFAAASPEIPVSLAPAPGAQRVFGIPELVRLVSRLGLKNGPLSTVCFEMRARVLTADDVLPVLQASLGMPDARIEIEELSRYAVPEGLVVFPRTGLQRQPAGQRDAAVLWKGYVQYGRSSQKPVWARVRILAERTVTVARTDLPAGEPIRSEQLRMEVVEGFPDDSAPTAPGQIVGLAPRRPIAAGEEVSPRQLQRVVAIRRGEAVNVEARCGLAVLRLSGEAETEAAIGETIKLRNLSSGRTFLAKVTAPGEALVDAGSSRVTAGVAR